MGDLSILKNAYEETQVGLWYNSFDQPDSIFKSAKISLEKNMSALEFYRLITPIVTFTKEGHSYTSLPAEVVSHLYQNGKYLPACVRIFDGKVYLLNDIENNHTTGFEISAINGISIEDIIAKFLSIEPSDGFNLTSKYHWIESRFSTYFLRFYERTSRFDLELKDPKSQKKIRLTNVAGYNVKEYGNLRRQVRNKIPSLVTKYRQN